ncbi:Protein of unknown function [Halpernia humi]|uniref:DUF2752 domain-containing protein n=1 Tax=Halpernia humi TaxID=493375 RepID=A0A1H5UJ68_9FLAO|nr:DUF2752 domain-containing protein [Halpernia humi]SEF74421.1 Protein of unknown function [Halpernia humi]
MWFKKNINSILFFVFILGGLGFYYFANPLSNSYFIKCPFKTLSGLDCPGCGSQRALHALLHGDIYRAFSYNLLFVLAIPYVFVGILFEWFGLKNRYPKTRKLLFGKTAIYMVVAIIILFFILRNL